MTTNQLLTIPKIPKLENSENYEFLRKEGLKFIERLSGKIWTDYNSHDPGITTHELLCYAITDLGYRTAHPIEDIIASGGDTPPLFTAGDVLPVNPTTELDIRKLVMDVEGVRNAWVTTAKDYEIPVYADLVHRRLTLEESKANVLLPIKGLYNIQLEFEPRYDGKNEEDLDDSERVVQYQFYNDIRREVRKTLMAHRTLCEDVMNIGQVEYEEIAVCADIELESNADVALTQAKIYLKLIDYFSPPINFYSLEEMVDKGKTIDEIFEGPLLKHGFIDNDELLKIDLRTVLHTSDIINEIMDMPEVKHVKSIQLIKYANGVVVEGPEPWELKLENIKAPRLSQKNSKFIFYKGVYPYMARPDEVQSEMLRLRQVNGRYRLQGHHKDLEYTKGTDREIESYFPVQNDFPMVYGTGPVGISNNSSEERKAQSKQFKAYLVFFEQILVNYLAQLAHTSHLFSHAPTIDRHNLTRNGNTYYTAALTGIVQFQDAALFERILAEDDHIKREAMLREFIDNFDEVLLAQYEWMRLALLYVTNGGYESDEHRQMLKLWRANLVELKNEAYVTALEAQLPPTAADTVAFEAIMTDLKNNFGKTYPEALQLMAEDDTTFADRRNRFLDHLMARFSESMAEYSLMLYRHREFINEPLRTSKRLIADKELFLTDYPKFSSQHSKAYNYKPVAEAADNGIWETANVTGLKHRIIRVLGMDDYKRRSIASDLLFIMSGPGYIPGEPDEQQVYWVEMIDPTDSSILLKTVNYKTEDCARDALHYLLHRGDEANRYEVRKFGSKFYYLLLDGCEVPGEIARGSLTGYNTRKEATDRIDYVSRIFDDYCDLEDFHIIEHLLLRPRTHLHPLMTACTPKVNIPPPLGELQRPIYRFRIIRRADYADPADSPIEFDDKDDQYGFILVANADDRIVMTSEGCPDLQSCLDKIYNLRFLGANRYNYTETMWRDKDNGIDLYYFSVFMDGNLIAESIDYTDEASRNDELNAVLLFLAYQDNLWLQQVPNKPNEFVDMDVNCPRVEDPYSFRISVFLPAWPTRFRSMSFRAFIEKVIRLETPAHIYPKICWIGYEQMQEFEDCYEAWIKTMAENEIPDPDVVKELLACMNNLANVYPSAVLHDCDDVQGDEPQVILGSTMLGSL
jgi:hypothetical protein